MKTLPISAATKAPTRRSPLTSTAAALPTRTGAIAAGSVRGRAAISQSIIRRLLGRASAVAGLREGSRTLRELREVGAAAFDVGVAALLSLLAHVEEQGRVVGELLEAGEAVLGGVEAR